MTEKPVLIEWYVVAFVGKANVFCRQCDNGYQALEVFTEARQKYPEWQFRIRRVARVEA